MKKTTVERLEHHQHTGPHEIAHWLRDPASWGRMDYTTRWPIHLLPLWLMRRLCDRYDRRRGK